VKNLPLLARCFKRLRAGGNDVRLELVGYGPEEQAVLDILKSEDSEHLHFHGFVSDDNQLSEIYRNADCLIISSHNEGFPRVIYEAMAHGLPVIATRVGGIPMQLTHDENACLVAPDDEEALAAAMRRVAKDAEYRLRLHRGGMAYVQEVLDEPAAAQHARIVQEVMASR
jgi:glycosyltransferase involved in cell wall biosynthesis